MSKPKNFVNRISSYIGDDLLSKNIWYLFFLAFLGIVYISNSHYAMKEIKEINIKTSELKTKRWFYIKAVSELMQKTKLSSMKKEVEPLGLKELLVPPQVIDVKVEVNK